MMIRYKPFQIPESDKCPVQYTVGCSAIEAQKVDYRKTDETELIQLAKQKDQDAVETLVKKHLNLILKIANKLYASNISSGLSLDDLFQEGVVGFLKAVENFNSENGATLSTYSTPYS